MNQIGREGRELGDIFTEPLSVGASGVYKDSPVVFSPIYGALLCSQGIHPLAEGCHGSAAPRGHECPRSVTTPAQAG